MESTLSRVAVIIARAGSRGLPNKAMQLLDGRPLVAWTIEHALGCREVDAVVLTTDGPDIAAVGRWFDIQVYDRPAALAADDVTIDEAARHGIRCFEQAEGRLCDHVAIMYANVALRPHDLTDRALRKLRTTGADSVQSVYPVGKMHPLWMRTVADDTEDRRGVLGMYQPNRNIYLQVVKATGGPQLHLAGTVTYDEQQNVVGISEMKAPVVKIQENIKVSLNAGGAAPSDVVCINVFTVDVEAYVNEGASEVIAFFGDTKPVSTTVEVPRLVHPGWAVEIEATAIID